ncbi:hypothetical protein RND61_14750 [Streptomyces sp. TRM76323]|uniref:Uncharacterized protein n=1 Tax=Streptomyces tamarix TaxID=3078565 RepID=A0ABU3QKP8_9ACTN|nr:hypothetical protein [Streptomyces tamarix]MDT9683322.1 hypothetical protein [Streptomyces tamarix]
MKYTDGQLGSPFPERKMKKRHAFKQVRKWDIERLDEYDQGEEYWKNLILERSHNKRWRAIMKAYGYKDKYDVLEAMEHWEWMEYTFSTRGYSIPMPLGQKQKVSKLSEGFVPDDYFD